MTVTPSLEKIFDANKKRSHSRQVSRAKPQSTTDPSKQKVKMTPEFEKLILESWDVATTTLVKAKPFVNLTKTPEPKLKKK